MWVHRISNINPELRTAICAYCGPVKVRRRPGGYKCSTGAYLADVKVKYGTQFDKRPRDCEVCSGKTRIVYDHSHSTGLFRGWLCNACNVALGLVKDDPERLRALALYVEKKRI
jgi:hypothetical protein